MRYISLLLVLMVLASCGTYTETLVSTNPQTANKDMASVSTEDVHIQMINSKSRLGVYTFDLTVFNQSSENLSFDPEDIYYEILEPAEVESDVIYSMLPDEVNEYKILEARQNNRTAAAVVGAIVAVTVVAILASDNDDDDNKKRRNKKRDSDESIFERDEETSSRRNRSSSNYSVSPRTNRSTETTSKTRKGKVIPDISWETNTSFRQRSRRPVYSDTRPDVVYHYHYYGYNRWNVLDFLFWSDPYDPYYRTPEPDFRRYEKLPRDLMVAQTLEPSEYAKGKVFFPAYPGEIYRFVIPIGDKEYLLHFKVQ